MRILSCTLTKVDVHDEYSNRWPQLVDAVVAANPSNYRPTCPVSYSLFTRYWADDYPTLRIATSGSDFCDLCTSLKSDIGSISKFDDRYDLFIKLLKEHRAEAKKEFLNYKLLQHKCQEDTNGNMRHYVFEVAEKVLLTRLFNQPGQLHFVTGLKFDIFGVSSTNQCLNFIYGLPEGHLPNEKTANVVFSMLHLAIEKESGSELCSKHHLLLHADNCAGQNKNRFVLWCLCFRVLLYMNNQVDLFFLIAGHTKNVCDGAFVHVKRRLKVRDVHTPQEMMNVIKGSNDTTKCIPSANVDWRDWKDVLRQAFVIPSKFGITKHHVFSFKSSTSGIVCAWNLSDSATSDEYTLLPPRKFDSVHRMWENVTTNDAFKSVITSFSNVSSAQQGTREKYLVHNILDRYYSENDKIGKEYFKSGA